MRILYVIEGISKKGGLERILIDKLNYLAENTTHEVVLMTLWHGQEKACFEISEKVKQVALGIKALPLPGGYILSLPVVVKRFNKAVRSVLPDSIVFFRAMGAFLIWQTSWTGKKIYESHLSLDAMNHRWIYPRMERKADAVVCLTKRDAENFKHARRVEVIPNFTNLKCEKSVAERTPTKRCMAVGRLSFEKDFSRMIRIWAKVHETHPDWCLDIYGEGEERQMLEDEIRGFGLDDTVFLKGFAEDITKEYCRHDILLLTSQCEGLPMALIEAQTIGVPAVAVDCPNGPSEIILDGQTGCLIPYTDDAAMVAAIERLMDDDALRKQIAEASIIASKRYSVEDIMAAWEELFRTI